MGNKNNEKPKKRKAKCAEMMSQKKYWEGKAKLEQR